ncbi:MAG: holo-ACP synthase [Candidatus Marinimicrobia bacterium]|nr:holo-ACP synthase [Candidatus Neomarinimicrobiota bacterium]MCF7880277.1 holo-ACP synthase [Candidatus Neomarinimicrobiota bacterium]
MNVGIDIVETQRIQYLIDTYSTRFLNKVFTEAEQKYCENTGSPYASYAGRFAAKEAIRKALQPMTTLNYLPFLEMEILPGENGVPVSTITRSGINQKLKNISLSISHEKNHAVACALAEEK